MADRRNKTEPMDRRGLSELSKEEMETVAGGLQLTTENTDRFVARKKPVVCADFDCSDECCTA